MQTRLALFLGAFLTINLAWGQEASPSKVVEVLPAERQSLKQSVRLFGRVRAKLDYTHVAETDGVLDQTLLAGQALKKGQVFASLDNAEVRTTYDLAQKAEKIAFEQYQRSKRLLEKKAVSQKTLETDRTQWIEAKQRSLQAKIAYEKTQFKAPFEGVLGVFKKREGAYIQRGDQVVTIYNPETLVVEIDIPEKYVRSLSTSNQVRVMGQEYSLTQLQRVIDPTTNMAPSFVEIHPSPEVVPGSVVSIDLILQEKNHALTIPKESLFIQGQQHFVYVVQEGKAHQREITLGLSEKERIEVTSGLEEGDLVVVKNPTRLIPDEEVRLLSQKSSPSSGPPSKKNDHASRQAEE